MATDDTVAAQSSMVPYSICFHAQQAAEKFLKAFLAFHGRPIPKTHDLARLVESCADLEPSFGALSADAASLNSFAVEIRYQASKKQAEERCPAAWSAMLAILDTVKQRLPGELFKVS